MISDPKQTISSAGAGVQPLAVIRDFYPSDSRALTILVRHGEQVTEKSLRIARRVVALGPDTDFIAAAAMLHDIGMILTDTPVLGCHGRWPYIRHGVLGREMLENLGMDRYGLVCERHVGAGLTVADIEGQGLPLPMRDMMPVTLEEKIIAYADKFFSKKSGRDGEKPFAQVLREIERYGRRQVETFLSWAKIFGDG